jgi:hypothetical protein
MSRQHFVNYTVMGKDYQAGPYQSQAEAELHHKDIKSYTGITNCWIGNTRDESRILIGAAA